MSHTHCKFCSYKYGNEPWQAINPELSIVKEPVTLHATSGGEFRLLQEGESAHIDCYIEAVFWKLRGEEEENDY